MKNKINILEQKEQYRREKHCGFSEAQWFDEMVMEEEEKEKERKE